MKRRDKWLIAIAVVAIVAIAIRLALPPVVRDYINDKLKAVQGYDAHIGTVHLALIRGAYVIDDIRIQKTGAGQPLPFFSCDHLDLSVEWPSLVHGSLVARAEFFNPQLIVAAEKEKKPPKGTVQTLADRFEQLFPFKFNTVRVHNGTVTFTAPGIRSNDAIKATGVEAEVSNLTNVVDKGKESFADYRVDAHVLDGGSVEITGSVNPLGKQPTFDVHLQLRNVQLPQLNPWLNQYIKAKAASGNFELYMELAAADGKFQGYAKPILENVNMATSEPEQNALKRIWEGVVDFAANVLENERTGQVAARIPFSGTIQKPTTSLLETIVSVLHNAFVSSFARSLEGSVSVRSVRENLKQVGEPADRKQEDNQQKKQGSAK